MTASLTGPIPGALYHVRLVATNAAGTTFGQDQPFTPAGDTFGGAVVKLTHPARATSRWRLDGANSAPLAQAAPTGLAG